jgi:hypothetical protein
LEGASSIRRAFFLSALALFRMPEVDSRTIEIDVARATTLPLIGRSSFAP